MNNLKPDRAVALLLLLSFQFSLLAQDYSNNDYPYIIPIGQSIYTQINGTANQLEPYTKIYFQKHGNTSTEIIEVGDYVIQQSALTGVRDTLFFEVQTFRINGTDTLVQSERLEKKEKVLTPIRTQLHRVGDRLYLSPKPKTTTIFNSNTSISLDNANEESSYFKLALSETFRFYNPGAAFGLLTIPVRIRSSTADDDFWSTAESGLNNLAFFGGFRSSWYRYSSGHFKQFNLLIGPYAGFTVSSISPGSTNFTINEEIRKAGATAGLSLLVGSEKLHFGLALGIESLIGGRSLNWAHQGKAYYGFSVAYVGSFNQFK